MSADREKLIQYYAPLGFDRVTPQCDYWIRSLDSRPEFPAIAVPKFKRIPKSAFMFESFDDDDE